MTAYRVEWSIDIEADTPEDAARQALVYQGNPTTVFELHRLARVVQRVRVHRVHVEDLRGANLGGADPVAGSAIGRDHHDDADRERQYSNAPDLDTHGGILREGR